MKSYLAGLFDAEGTACITGGKPRKHNRNPYHLEASIINNDIRNLRLLREKVGFGRVTVTKERPAKNTHENGKFTFHSEQALTFLNVILPYLIVKRNVAWIGMCFQDYKRRKERENRHKPHGSGYGALSPDDIEARAAAKEIMSKINKRS